MASACNGTDELNLDSSVGMRHVLSFERCPSKMPITNESGTVLVSLTLECRDSFPYGEGIGI